MTTISNTTASLLRRTFASMDRETALAVFNQVLDTSSAPSANHELVEAALQDIYDAGLKTLVEIVGGNETRTQVGAVYKREVLLDKLVERLGSELKTSELRALLTDTLACGNYEGVLGAHGGMARSSDPKAPPKPAPKKRAPKAAPAAE